ncbi:MAG TPA: MarR family transcriptional regulator [Candidatus Acidoferrum sp.]|nr:MarR family transcriptional regulator [Candidatus Acidoferrum sp.]
MSKIYKSTRRGRATNDLGAATRAGQLLGRELSTAVIAFHEAVAAQLHLSATEWKSLGVLDQHGPLTAGRLAELSGFTTGAITGIVDRLEGAGHVRRERHPTDRRSVIIHPVRFQEVRKRVAPILESLGKRMAELCTGYTPTQLEAIGRFFAQTTDVLRSETAKLKARPPVSRQKHRPESAPVGESE